MLDYLLNYLEDYEIEYLKEQYTEEMIELLDLEKGKVVAKIEEILANDKEADIYLELAHNIDDFI